MLQFVGAFFQLYSKHLNHHSSNGKKTLNILYMNVRTQVRPYLVGYMGKIINIYINIFPKHNSAYSTCQLNYSSYRNILNKGILSSSHMAPKINFSLVLSNYIVLFL